MIDELERIWPSAEQKCLQFFFGTDRGNEKNI
jgi:hypothetical protein